MKIGIVTIGSRGDVQPYLALSQELMRRGHSLRIITFRNFQSWIQEEGIEYYPIPGDAKDVMRLLIGEQVSSGEYFKNLDKLLIPIKKEFLAELENACKDMDLLIYSTLGSITWHIADKYHIPCIRAFFCPLDPTGEFPTMTAPILPLGKLYNRFTFKCGDLLWSSATRRLLNDWRVENGLRPIQKFEFPYRYLHGQEIPTLYAYSTFLSPKPAEYDSNKYLTGFWIKSLEAEWEADPSLVEFLNKGEKPIYIGFGSTVGGSYDEALRIVLESLINVGQRAILSSGWGDLSGSNLPDTVFQINNVPHEWLFQHVSAVVHHGGAGTTAAGLRAGVPTIIIPFGGDQPFWGQCVYRLGVGPKPILRKHLTVKNLTKALREVINNDEIKKNAKALGVQLRNENGVKNAADMIDSIRMNTKTIG
ncbi:glycosyltransferase [Anaerosporobacter faecicola]|uniref:glycosyltransferase n=1 Tax=Anaerosporobacter faecicola TaxID=2718714 RepID=UPI00143B89B8|nr:glycosyltransferase [Anaerosporobacter faecicola]